MQIRLTIEYDGTDFLGWQIQAKGRTVQGVLETAVEKLLGHPARVSAAGRTDAGVHAAGQVVTFHTNRAMEPTVVMRALNALTPRDLAILSAGIVPDDFDPRRSAMSRSYVYRIWNRPVRSPFWRRYSWHVRHPLALEAMQSAAATLLGEHDFSSFRAAGCDAKHPVRTVLRSELRREGELITYEIEANAFLRHMVRNIAGTLVEVGMGMRSPASVAELLAAADRTRAGMTAPAQGLCLLRVSYPADQPPGSKVD